MLTLSEGFIEQKESTGIYKPVFLVELPALGKFYATRDPGFSSTWIAGMGLIAGGPTKAGEDLDAYETILIPLRDSGIGSIEHSFDEHGVGRIGNGSFQLLNQDLLSTELQEDLLLNATVMIRMGFLGLPREDYVCIFRGIIDSHTSNFEHIDFSLIDDTVRQRTTVPPIVGTDFFANAFTQGQALPILLGNTRNMPVSQIVGDVDTLLGVDATTADTYLLTVDLLASFPYAGSLLVESVANSNTVAYRSRYLYTIGGNTYMRFDLIGNLANNMPAGSKVSLTNHKQTYLVGMGASRVRNIRVDGGSLSEAPVIKNIPIDPTGEDHRKATILEFDTTYEKVTITSGDGNLLLDPDDLNPGAGGWSTTTYNFEKVIKGLINSGQTTNSDAYWQIDTLTPGHVYHLSITIENIDAYYVAISVGTDTSPNEYGVFTEVATTTRRTYDFDFTAIDAIFRLTLTIGNVGGAYPEQTVYFSNWDLYDATIKENPATQLQALIDEHIPNLVTDAASFEEARSMLLAAGDRLSGAIQQPEEQQTLLGRLSEQFRSRTFLSESGQQKLIVFDQSRSPAYVFDTSNIYRGSMQISRSPLSEVYTHYYVYYNRNPDTLGRGDLGGREAFRGLVYCTPTETNHTTEAGIYQLAAAAQNKFRITRTFEIYCDMVFSQKTAENLLSYVVRRGTHQRVVCQFTTFLNGQEVEIADFVRISHPLLPAASQFATFDVLSKTKDPNGCFLHFQCEEINPFKFGGFSEHWEQTRSLFPKRVRFEEWEYLPLLYRKIWDEHWERYLEAEEDGFQRWTSNTLGNQLKFKYRVTIPNYYSMPTVWHSAIVPSDDTTGLYPPGNVTSPVTWGLSPAPTSGLFSLNTTYWFKGQRFTDPDVSGEPPLTTGVTLSKIANDRYDPLVTDSGNETIIHVAGGLVNADEIHLRVEEIAGKSYLDYGIFLTGGKVTNLHALSGVKTYIGGPGINVTPTSSWTMQFSCILTLLSGGLGDGNPLSAFSVICNFQSPFYTDGGQIYYQNMVCGFDGNNLILYWGRAFNYEYDWLSDEDNTVEVSALNFRKQDVESLVGARREVFIRWDALARELELSWCRTSDGIRYSNSIVLSGGYTDELEPLTRLTLGAIQPPNYPYSGFFRGRAFFGYMGDINIWERYVSDSEITQLISGQEIP